MKQNKVRENLANEFIKSLSEDKIPWKQEWQSMSVPQNAVTEKKYRGVNYMMLLISSAMRGYSDPRWCTYNQAQDKGWQVRRGEKGVQIEFWSMYDTETKKKLSNAEVKALSETLTEEEFAERVKPVSAVYTVFNAEQIDGIPEMEMAKNNIENEEQLIEARDTLLKNMDVGFKEGGDRAFYRPSDDSITLPKIAQFSSKYAYMATMLHEAGHATGHKKRLDRNISNTFGSTDYAKEELRAEIASAFTAAAIGIDNSKDYENLDNHKAYIQSWIEVIKNEPNELFAAIKDAEKISDYLLEKGEFLKEKSQEKDINEPQRELVASFEYEHNDGDQIWSDYTNYFYDKVQDKYIKEYKEGYYGSKYESEVSRNEIIHKLAEVIKEKEEHPQTRGGYKIFNYPESWKDEIEMAKDVTVLYDKNRNFKEIQTEYVALTSDILFSTAVFNEWINIARSAEERNFSDHTISNQEFAKKIANAIEKNEYAFSFEGEKFDLLPLYMESLELKQDDYKDRSEMVSAVKEMMSDYNTEPKVLEPLFTQQEAAQIRFSIKGGSLSSIHEEKPNYEEMKTAFEVGLEVNNLLKKEISLEDVITKYTHALDSFKGINDVEYTKNLICSVFAKGDYQKYSQLPCKIYSEEEMKEYIVNIREILEKEITVSADTREQAERQVEEQYWNGNIVLTADDYKASELTAKEVVKEKYEYVKSVDIGSLKEGEPAIMYGYDGTIIQSSPVTHFMVANSNVYVMTQNDTYYTTDKDIILKHNQRYEVTRDKNTWSVYDTMTGNSVNGIKTEAQAKKMAVDMMYGAAPKNQDKNKQFTL